MKVCCVNHSSPSWTEAATELATNAEKFTRRSKDY